MFENILSKNISFKIDFNVMTFFKKPERKIRLVRSIGDRRILS